MPGKNTISAAFASDNAAGEHPEIAKKRFAIAGDYALGYGNDQLTTEAIGVFKKHFGEEAEPLFTFGGTGANVVALSTFLKPYQAVVCPHSSHIYNDECGAPEKFTGSKLIPVSCEDGKLRVEQVNHVLAETRGIVHRVQPAVISISQPTEMGTVYTLDEVGRLAAYARENGMALHVDGARLANAAVHLNRSLKEMAAGADVLSFGGTKNGLAFGEAVLFFNREKAAEAAYIQKQAAQLPSKMAMISHPMAWLLESGLWKKNGEHANQMAARLAEKLSEFPEITVNQAVESNGIFCSVPAPLIPELRKTHHFAVWNSAISEIRLMTSFATTEEDLSSLVDAINGILH